MEYRRVESHDGSIVRVQEYRRHVSSPAGSGQTSGSRNFATDAEGSSMKSANRSDAHREKPRQAVVEVGAKPRQSETDRHVTMISPRPNRSRGKPVIIQQSPDASKDMTKAQLKNTGFFQNAIPSPPPTPRLGRLPTPDIPELDESPFCDCCDGSSRFKYCTFCGCEIDRHML